MRHALTSIASCLLATSVHAGPPEEPSDLPYDHDEYVAWLRTQTQKLQLEIGQFCSAHPRDYEPLCGGIGPLHLSRPPRKDPCAGLARRATPEDLTPLPKRRAAWLASLAPGQKKYVDQKCRGGRGYGSELCGPQKVKGCSTPLVVSFDDAPVAYSQGARFAFSPGAPTATDWPTDATPWIALDRDGDGAITSGAELFGSSTVLPGGTTAVNGFEALAALDDNGDGVIDARDRAFGSLVLWFDRDADGIGRGDELVPLASRVVSISLAAKSDPRCDARGNCEGPRARITWRDATGDHPGTVVDVYLPER
jgi:hypothetical protein